MGHNSTGRRFSVSAAGELNGKQSSADAAVLCCNVAAEARNSLLPKCRWVFVDSKQLNSIKEKAICSSPLLCALLLHAPHRSVSLGMNTPFSVVGWNFRHGKDFDK